MVSRARRGRLRGRPAESRAECRRRSRRGRPQAADPWRRGHVDGPAPSATSPARRRADRRHEDRGGRPEIDAAEAAVIDAAGMVVMPGFIDTHHHQFETALRGFLADAHADQRRPAAERAQLLRDMLQKFSMVYRPEDVYINELFGALAQLDAGVTTVMDVSPDPPLARAFRRRGRRRCATPAAVRSSAISRAGASAAKYPEDARRLKRRVFLLRRPAAHHGRWAARSTSPATRRPGRSGASSACRSRCTSSAPSACGRPSTHWRSPASSGRTTSSST